MIQAAFQLRRVQLPQIPGSGRVHCSIRKQDEAIWLPRGNAATVAQSQIAVDIEENWNVSFSLKQDLAQALRTPLVA
jgi:hypothetical protein